MTKMPSYFRDCGTTLHKASYDSDQKEYMCDSSMQIFNFDGLKKWYVKKYMPKQAQKPCSNDALWLDVDHAVFIEFKNGKIDEEGNNKIIFKVYDSLLMLFDDKFDLSYCRPDFKQNISYTREHMDYILVYNADKYDEDHHTTQTKKGLERQGIQFPKLEEESKRQSPQNSKSRTAIYKTFRALGKRNFILFGLDRFKSYLFRQVYTMDQAEFERYLQQQGAT